MLRPTQALSSSHGVTPGPELENLQLLNVSKPGEGEEGGKEKEGTFAEGTPSNLSLSYSLTPAHSWVMPPSL